MAKYWIKNRGRVQGPLSKERIQGLMRRGRFSRHFFVSTDQKEWLPAEDFPELFGSRRSSRQDDDFEDDTPFQSGGSPFDDDDDSGDGFEERPSRRGGRPKPARKPVAVFDDDDDEAFEEADDDWDDDEDWDDESDGLIGWIENNVKIIGGVLVLGLLLAGWFVLFRESFVQDQADLETLQKVHGQITTAHATGVAAQQWIELQNQVNDQLAAMVGRLEKAAGATDAVKQELLFAARDDLPRMFRELPDGVQSAAQRSQRRFAVIDNMIRNEVRYRGAQAGSPISGSAASGNGPPGAKSGTPTGDAESPPAESENRDQPSSDTPAPTKSQPGNSQQQQPAASAAG